MRPIRDLKKWWKIKTGKDDTPFDGETPFWILSLALHVVLLVVLASVALHRQARPRVSVLVAPSEETDLVESPPLVQFDYESSDELGNNDSDDFQAMMEMAPHPKELPVDQNAVEQELRDLGNLKMAELIPQHQASLNVHSIAVNGIAGHATTGTSGAIDRITHEILLSLEERKTLVVWMFDQSASLLRQREEVLNRFDRVYRELESLQNAGAQEFKKHDDVPLLTQVVGFGIRAQAMLKKPTADVNEIKQAVAAIETDTTGVENVFSAVTQIGSEMKHLCKVDRRTGDRERNVMIVIISDEAGDDTQYLDSAVDVCRTNQIRVYVIGIPAPFGRENTYVKWVDPDPSFDQSVQWAPVRQGPESLLPERIKLHFTQNEQEEQQFDSGFGPYGLTRLCYQSGGIYFTVHPNRGKQGRVSARDTAAYSAHLTRFFDPQVMRRYRPDYTTEEHYRQLVSQNEARFALVTAAHQSSLRPMQPPRLRFEKLDEARFVNDVSQAQRAAAVLEPKINALYDTLKQGEHDRDSEVSPRWKAGYDLAMGQVLAVKIRAETYNAMLAMAKTRLKFEDPKNNTWVLRPANEISTGSQSENMANQARTYLQRVVDEHADTPWAYLAQRELQSPIGWKWSEAYTAPPQPRPQRQVQNNNNRPRPNRPQQQSPPPKPRRAAPKL